MKISPVNLLRVFGTPYHGMVCEGLFSIYHRLQIHCIVNVNICIKGPDDKTKSSACLCKYLGNQDKKLSKVLKSFPKVKEKKNMHGKV